MLTMDTCDTIVLFLMCASLGSGSRLENVDDYLDICLIGNNHKEKPGPESRLYAQCTPWVSRSCCTENTARRINVEHNFLNFNLNHCKNLTERCRQYFIQDFCFYECSPNVGPWLVEDVRKIRKERIKDAPLCQSDCTQWWDACKNDFTCVENWAEDFVWSTGVNKCPPGSKCRPFHEVFSGASHFCEHVFGPSYKVVPDAPESCFHLWFDPRYPNPNEKVARKKIASMKGKSVQLNPLIFLLILSVLSAVKV